MTTDEARAARDAALLAWWAAGPASLSAESDAAWAAYKAAGAAVERARNLPEGSGTPAPPPPPPPDIRTLEAAMYAAHQAYQDAADALARLEVDPAATFDAVYRAWDVAAAADIAQRRATMAYRTARKEQGVPVR